MRRTNWTKRSSSKMRGNGRVKRKRQPKGRGWDGAKFTRRCEGPSKKRDKAIAASQELHQAEGEEDPQGSDEEIEAEEDLEWEDVFGPRE